MDEEGGPSDGLRVKLGALQAAGLGMVSRSLSVGSFVRRRRRVNYAWVATKDFMTYTEHSRSPLLIGLQTTLSFYGKLHWGSEGRRLELFDRIIK